MKNFTKAIFLFAIILATSCGQDFIDLAPVSNANVSSFYKNANDINQAVISAYDALQSRGQYGRAYILFMESRSDNTVVSDIIKGGGEEGDFDLFRESAVNSYLNASWLSCYQGIQRCNAVLNRIDDVEMDDSERSIRMGEVYFLRALTYFNMARIWGEVPVLTKELESITEVSDHKRQPVEEVYAQIIADLNQAKDLLPANHAQVGRATKGAALALLGKVYLTRQAWGDAVNTLNQVQGYTLLANYADVFDVNNENNGESIFEVQYTAGLNGEGSIYLVLHAPMFNTTVSGGVGTGSAESMPMDQLFNAYEPADTRRTMFNIAMDNNGVNVRYTTKYNGLPKNVNDEDNNFIVLRYADVMLMLAEALNEQGYSPNGQAFTLLNQIRIRAGASNYTAIDLPDQAAFRDAVLEERRLELVHENHRWFDLVRTGRYVDVMNNLDDPRLTNQIQSFHRYFPIPQSQIDTNPGNIYQNEGYGL